MSIWAIADLHLAFSTPSKSMELFGPAWHKWAEKIEENWRAVVKEEDLVLIAGDICWAMRLEEALIDLAWIDKLPGTKVISRGNHDYWWASSAKMEKVMPSSIHFIHNNHFVWNDVAIGGARLWDTEEYHFSAFTEMKPNPKEKEKAPKDPEEEEKIFQRELERLRISLSSLPKDAATKIAMVHYPPIGADLAPSRCSEVLESFGIDICVFGHLHSLKPNSLPFGSARGIQYHLTSCDYLSFQPIKIEKQC